MTSYAEFAPYYLRSIWREGDAALIEDLPRLVKEAESRISRDLRDANIVTTQEIALVAPADTVPLPADFRELIKLDFVSDKVARAVSPDTMNAIRRQEGAYRDASALYYAIYGGSVHIARWGGGIIGLTMTYYMGVRPFSTTPDTPSFYDRHPDFFLAALNVQTYGYMRDFDLSNEYNGKYVALLEDMRRESNYTMYPSGQMASPMPDTAYSSRYSPVTAGGGTSVVDGTPYDFVSIYQQAKQ